MEFTFGTFVTNMVFSGLLLHISAHFLESQKTVNERMVKIIFICIILSMFRMLIPVEFFFSHTIGIPVVLPHVHSMLKISLFHGYINLKEFLLLIWLTGALVKGYIILHKYQSLKKILMMVPEIQSRELTYIVSEMHLCKRDIRIVKLNGVLPCITGLLHPVIILPDIEADKEKISYILKHELLHYIHHDLWFKAAGELLGIIYWWNPVIIILNKQINFMTEIKDDMILTAQMNERQKIEYSQCMIRLVQETTVRKTDFSLGLAKNNIGLLEKRISYIFNQSRKDKKNGMVLLLLLLSLVSHWLIFEPRYPIPPDCQIYDDLKDYEIICEDGQYYIIENGEKIKIDGPDFIRPYEKGDEKKYEKN